MTTAVSNITARNIIEYPTTNFNRDVECNPNNAVTLHASLYTIMRSILATIEYVAFNVFDDSDIISYNIFMI